MIRFVALIIYTLACLCMIINGAVMHSHSPNLNKEREEDGSFSPRDRHLSDSSQHNTEFDHEAILGSAKVADEFDHLSQEESILRLRKLLLNMDLNGDKHIDKRELKSWILRSFRMLSQEEADERLEDADENQDGRVTWLEYISDAYGCDEDSMAQHNEQLITDDKIMWKSADVNGDNILEGDEWVAFSNPQEHPTMLPHILEQTLRDKDWDHDGSINFQEYIGERGASHDKEWLYIEKDKFDNELDKDKNGKLVGSEILSWVVPSNEEIAIEEVDHLFASSDDDQDGLLSFDEVVAHHDTFVGSEATDYGEHINNIHQFADEL